MKAAGLAGTALALGVPGMSFGATAKKPISIGVIGTGSRGAGLVRIMKDIPNLQVMACCDVLPQRLEAAMKHAEPKAKAYADYRALIDDKTLDAVLVATPLYLHSPMSIEALEAGKHVYCEKTMAYDIDQAFQMVAMAKKNPKLIFQTGHQYHSSRLYYKVVETIQKGYIGTVTGFDCQWNRNGDWRRPVADPALEKLINWRMYREYSCGLLAELSAHQIDFVNWVTESHPKSVVGTGGIDYWKDGRETYDNVHAIFDYPNGIKASFTCTTANAYEGYQIKVLGDQATIVITPNAAWIYPENTAENKEMGLVDGVSGATAPVMDKNGAIPVNVDHADPSKQALEDFAQSIYTNTQPLSNVMTGARVSIAMRMALNSIMEQRKVEWKDSYNV